MCPRYHKSPAKLIGHSLVLHDIYLPAYQTIRARSPLIVPDITSQHLKIHCVTGVANTTRHVYGTALHSHSIHPDALTCIASAHVPMLSALFCLPLLYRHSVRYLKAIRLAYLGHKPASIQTSHAIRGICIAIGAHHRCCLVILRRHRHAILNDASISRLMPCSYTCSRYLRCHAGTECLTQP